MLRKWLGVAPLTRFFGQSIAGELADAVNGNGGTRIKDDDGFGLWDKNVEDKLAVNPAPWGFAGVRMIENKDGHALAVVAPPIGRDAFQIVNKQFDV